MLVTCRGCGATLIASGTFDAADLDAGLPPLDVGTCAHCGAVVIADRGGRTWTAGQAIQRARRARWRSMLRHYRLAGSTGFFLAVWCLQHLTTPFACTGPTHGLVSLTGFLVFGGLLVFVQRLEARSSAAAEADFVRARVTAPTSVFPRANPGGYR